MRVPGKLGPTLFFSFNLIFLEETFRHNSGLAGEYWRSDPKKSGANVGLFGIKRKGLTDIIL